LAVPARLCRPLAILPLLALAIPAHQRLAQASGAEPQVVVQPGYHPICDPRMEATVASALAGLQAQIWNLAGVGPKATALPHSADTMMAQTAPPPPPVVQAGRPLHQPGLALQSALTYPQSISIDQGGLPGSGVAQVSVIVFLVLDLQPEQREIPPSGEVRAAAAPKAKGRHPVHTNPDQATADQNMAYLPLKKPVKSHHLQVKLPLLLPYPAKVWVAEGAAGQLPVK
jgi:hypothetical protein